MHCSLVGMLKLYTSTGKLMVYAVYRLYLLCAATGLSHGYNIPKVEHCPELPDFLNEKNLPEILRLRDDKELSDHMRRLLCDGYICMYQSNSLRNYR